MLSIQNIKPATPAMEQVAPRLCIYSTTLAGWKKHDAFNVRAISPNPLIP